MASLQSCTKEFTNALEVYRDFISKYMHIEFSKFFVESWYDSDLDNKLDKNYEFEFDSDGIEILNDHETIKSKFKDFGIVELRPYDPNIHEVLVIGCGNKPLANCGGYPFEDEDEKISYQTEHSHENCYTINPGMEYNPSCVGFFSYNTFYNIPDGAFKKIIVEGIKLKYNDTFHKEIYRLLKFDGVLIIDDETVYHKNDLD